MYEGIKDIYSLLDNKRLKEALVQLESICTQCNDWPLRSRIEELQTAYGYMLQYARMGMQDPNRNDIFRQFIRQAYELTEWTDISLQAQTSSGLYYQHLRTFRERPAMSYSELQIRLESFTEDIGTVSIFHHNEEKIQAETKRICQQHEQALDELFNKIWTSRAWNDAEVAEVEQIISSLLVPANDKAVLVSAVTLSLFHLFDERKASFLMKNCGHEDVQVSQRATIGTALFLHNRMNWMERYPALLSQFTLLLDNDTFRQDLSTIQMQFLMTMETDKISRKMHDEIIPGMMKNPQIREGKFRFDETEEGEEQNPEWEEWMDKSGMNEKIRELGELQMQGADVYMSTFAQLKSYSFFNQVSHWFYPFDFNHTDLLTLSKDFGTDKLSALNLIIQSDTFCNSDKYSFCLTLAQMPPAMKEQNIQAIQMQTQMDDEQKNMLQEMLNRPRASKSVSRQYIQDLYRFYKIWGSKHPNQEKDIFKSVIAWWECPYTAPAFKDTDKMKNIADFFFQKEHEVKAESIYLTIIGDQTESAEIYQKLGYICQKSNRISQAIAHYERADLLSPDNAWTLKRLAQCYKRKRNYEKAVFFFRKVEQTSPDNLKNMLQIGECLIKLEKYEEALPYLHKVEYLEKAPNNARRAIGWCYFIQGKYEEALKYYNQLLQEESPAKQDWMNAGHIYIGLKQYPQAIEHYTKAKELCQSHTEFLDMFNEDKQQLLTLMPEEDLDITLDLLV